MTRCFQKLIHWTPCQLPFWVSWPLSQSSFPVTYPKGSLAVSSSSELVLKMQCELWVLCSRRSGVSIPTNLYILGHDETKCISYQLCTLGFLMRSLQLYLFLPLTTFGQGFDHCLSFVFSSAVSSVVTRASGCL